LAAAALIVTLAGAGCDAPAPPPRPPAIPASTADATPAPAVNPATPAVVDEPDATDEPEPPAPKPIGIGPVTSPETTIFGAWRGVRFEGAGDQNAAGEKLAATMLLQFSEKAMAVTLGPAGTVKGPWKVTSSKPDHLEIERSTPAPARRFQVRFHGPNTITMTLSSRQAVRFARILPVQAGQARPEPRDSPATPPK
jgi:hypothetical protein